MKHFTSRLLYIKFSLFYILYIDCQKKLIATISIFMLFLIYFSLLLLLNLYKHIYVYCELYSVIVRK